MLNTQVLASANGEYMVSGGRDVEIIEELTLGRQVALGDLYNARTNRIWTGTSFWDRATIDAHKYRNKVPTTQTSFFSAATAYQRMSFMDIKAELQLGFMSMYHVFARVG